MRIDLILIFYYIYQTKQTSRLCSIFDGDRFSQVYLARKIVIMLQTVELTFARCGLLEKSSKETLSP